MRRSKFGAVATTIDNIRFASKLEARRYQELRLLEKAGQITELELQPKFPIQTFVKGQPVFHREPVCTYIADFRYREGPRGVLVIEDVKSAGTRTPIYRLKKKFVEKQYGIAIQEV